MQLEKEQLPGERAIIESGVRLGDLIRLQPFSERARNVKISRTRLSIEKAPTGEFSVGPLRWELPGPMGQSGYELVLDDTIEDGRFMIQALGRSFFIHNGSPSFRSYLIRGDCVDIGYNRLEFLVAESESSEEGHEIPESIMRSDLNLLLMGETGTGKTRLAKFIHEQSGKRGKFVHLNLSAIPEALLASELFGHLKGAFTGAIYTKAGAVEEANDGTLFLDEVDSLNHDLQVKLLLFLDNKKFRPVGANFEKSASPRIIFASGRELSELVSRGDMRRDFFFRLASGYTHRLSPLRAQPKSISKFANRWASQNGATISSELHSFLRAQSWPGNFRELIGFLERKKAVTPSAYLCVDENDEKNPQAEIEIEESQSNILPMEAIKSEYARKIYRRLGSNLKLTARTLEISPNTLRKFLLNSAS